KAVVNQRAVFRNQAVAQMHELAIHRQRIHLPMREVEDGGTGRLINTAPFHADKTILDDVDATNPMFPAKFVERLHYLKRRKLGGRRAVSPRTLGPDGARPSSFRSQAGRLRHTYAIPGFKGKI